MGGSKCTVGGLTMAMGGPAMACRTALATAPPLVSILLSSLSVSLPNMRLEVLDTRSTIVAIIAAECGKAVSKSKSRYPGYRVWQQSA